MSLNIDKHFSINFSNGTEWRYNTIEELLEDYQNIKVTLLNGSKIEIESITKWSGASGTTLKLRWEN